MSQGTAEQSKPNPWRDISKPFIDLVHAPRALWGINLNYLLEGFVYFGMVTYLAMFFNQYVKLNDQYAGWMVGALTFGITLAMFILGGFADKYGVRRGLILALLSMLCGRLVLAGSPLLGLPGGALFSPFNGVALLGILLIVTGYGIYQPAAYAAVRQFTTPATAGMGYAMLYALMNLGGFLPSFMPPLRERVGIAGTFWFYSGVTLIGLVWLVFVLSPNTVKKAVEAAQQKKTDQAAAPGAEEHTAEPAPVVFQGNWFQKLGHWFRNHPLADAKFSFFIFCLIPVQTLFAHQWLTMPLYVERAFRGTWVGAHFETAVGFNSLLIFFFCPIVAALTTKVKVYNQMIVGTAVMAAPTFLLTLGPNPLLLGVYIVLMTIGEAMWQPRFLQYAAEIAPPGRTGAYMGVAQFPWFLTKMIVPIYSGWMLAHFCPEKGPTHTETMWLIYGIIAISSTVMLVLAKGWVGKDFKTKSE